MEAYKLTYKQFGKQAILIEWPCEINEDIRNDIIKFKNKIHNKNSKVILEVINAYNSLTIFYNTIIDKIDDEIFTLKVLYSQPKKPKTVNTYLWEIPVCYDLQFGIDLEQIAQHKEVGVDQVIKWHSNAIYTVYFIGFLPGFLYLGGLNTKLVMPRKATPRLSVDKGSVGIGGSQTGVYPQNSAGGWNIIGKTPISFFDSSKTNPCFAKAGDSIQFKAIDYETYLTIETQVKNGAYQLKKQRHD